ncbi:M48 family metalloprotease [Arthrobacter sp. 9E18]|uniref:M48 family metalloprotease n=1 Tax=unclassified Arthrobacter TaxID=235627 RepID=UPI0034D7017C
MPLRVVESCPPAGLRWLIAHEVGHAATRNTFQEHFRLTVLTTALISALLCLGTTVAGAVADLSGNADEWGFLRGMSMGVLVLALIWFGSLRRADERRADIFAAAYMGDVRGAREYFAFTNSARHSPSLAERFIQMILWPLRSHPSHPNRINLMKKHLPHGAEGPCDP